MLKIKARAPLRLGLAGGGTDVAPYCNEHGGLVINTTIDRYTYSIIELVKEKGIFFVSSDKKCETFFESIDEIKLNSVNMLLHATYLHMINNYNNKKQINMKLTTFCDSPPGSGLGTSSTLVVSMVKAFSDLLDLSLSELMISKIAYDIERVECSLLGGKQDQYSASFGGFNYIEFLKSDDVVVNKLELPKEIVRELESSLLLFFTGVSRDSDKIILNQSTNMKNNDKKAMDALHKLKEEAKKMKNNLLTGNFEGIVQSMQIGWENKKKSSSVISNPLIEKIYDTAIKAGALAGKVSGAGGGGFMIFFVLTEKRKSVIDSLAKFNGEVSNTHFTDIGVRTWKVK